MPNWNEILVEIDNEINVGKNYTLQAIDKVISKYINELSSYTKRNTIIYYSAWLQKNSNINNLSIQDLDKNGFMAVIHKLDKDEGLDLILHTPGGDVAATESIIDYLQSIFEDNIRVIIPQLAMSGGTMIACCAKEIIMGKHSSLGPIDPQLANGMAANGIIEEFETAKEDIIKNQSLAELWKPILSSYPPAFIGKCKKSIKWAQSIARKGLESNMFKDDHSENARDTIEKIINELTNDVLSHSRHYSLIKSKEIGLKVMALESDPELQDKVLSVHHSLMITFEKSSTCKAIINDKGAKWIFNSFNSSSPPTASQT